MSANRYPATRVNWPAKLVGSSHQVQLLFHHADELPPEAAVESAAGRALEGSEVSWNWFGREVIMMIKGRVTLEMLDAAMSAIDAVHPTAQRFYTGDAARPKRVKMPPVDMVPIRPQDVPRETPKARPPAQLFGSKLYDAWRSPHGVWIASEYAKDAWSISAVHEERPAERPTVLVPRHACTSVVFSEDGNRALIVGRWTIREVEVPTLATRREVHIPRTIRDNNGTASVLYHPTESDRLIVGTETGMFVVASSGDATAFAHCHDIQRLEITASGRCVFACQVDPDRGELFALAGDELRSIGKFKPIRDLIVDGDRIFARPSKQKAFEIIGGDAAWHAVFGTSV